MYAIAVIELTLLLTRVKEKPFPLPLQNLLYLKSVFYLREDAAIEVCFL